MKPFQTSLIAGIQLYRWILSPAKTALFGPLGRCRFTPTCSEYALLAVRRHGSLAGIALAARRLGRCHPWGGCGLDPVPEILTRRHFTAGIRAGSSRAPTPISSR